MKLPRRKFLHLAAGAAVLPAVSRSAWAQTYPSRPITMIVPFAPGGLTDVIGRVMAEGMRTTLGQPVIVENVGGANGSIGTGRVARAASDGYTLVVGIWNTHVANGATYRKRLPSPPNIVWRRRRIFRRWTRRGCPDSISRYGRGYLPLRARQRTSSTSSTARPWTH